MSQDIQSNAESEELLDVAAAIGRLSAAASDCNYKENYCDSVTDMADTAIRKTIEENEDLKRQIIFLQQQLEEKDRRTKVLENILLAEGKIFSSSANVGKSDAVNTASQVVYGIKVSLLRNNILTYLK